MKFRIITLCLFVFTYSCKENTQRQDVKFTVLPLILEHSSGMPSLVSNGDNLLLSWVEMISDSLSVLKYAELKNNAWSTPSEITRGNDWFVNWADFPTIAENNGNLLTHHLRKSSPETFSYDVKLNLKEKGQNKWQTAVQLHSDSTKTEHGFVSMLPYKDSFIVTWLDGRNTSGAGHGHHGGAMTIRAAEVSTSGEVNTDTLLDDRTCDCCQTTAAITDNGPVIIYRDRSNDEIRDISIVRLLNGTWTTPQPVYNDNWNIKGCPVNGPKADALRNNLVVAWFTEAQGDARVQLCFSANGGEKFDKPIRIGNKSVLGRVDVVMVNEDSAIVSWIEQTVSNNAQFMMAKVNSSGEIGQFIKISEIDASRNSGFPQMELVQDKIFLAWTHVGLESKTIKTAVFPLSGL